MELVSPFETVGASAPDGSLPRAPLTTRSTSTPIRSILAAVVNATLTLESPCVEVEVNVSMLFSPAIASSMGLGDLRLDRVGIGTRVGGDYRHLGDAEARDDGNPEREERVDAVARQRDSQCDDGERIADRVTSNGVHGSVPLAFTDYGSHPASGQRLCRRNDRNPVSDGGGPWQDDGVACQNTAGDLNHRRVGQTDLDNLQLGAIVDVGIDVLLAVALLECRGRHDDGIVNPRRLDHHGRRHARAELASWIRRHDVHAGGAGPGVDAGIDGLDLCFKGLIGECETSSSTV